MLRRRFRTIPSRRAGHIVRVRSRRYFRGNLEKKKILIKNTSRRNENNIVVRGRRIIYRRDYFSPAMT